MYETAMSEDTASRGSNLDKDRIQSVFPFLFCFLLAKRLLVHSLALVESVEHDGDMQYSLR